MKRILSFFIMSAILAMSYQSQGQVNFTGTGNNVGDSIRDAATDTIHYTLTKGYANIAIQPVVTKASGTAAGVLRFYCSVNGTNWITLADTLALTNVTTNTGLFIFQKPVRYWRIIASGGTTVKAKLAAKLQTD